jgi:hypothetical protein
MKRNKADYEEGSMNGSRRRIRSSIIGRIQGVLPAAIAVTIFSGCLPAVVPDVPADATATDSYRATPEADSPAAGICASFNEEVIRIEIRAWPDGVPDPRCIEVRADQKMILANSAPEPVEFLLGRYSATVDPGDAFTVEFPFGDYLLPGAHSLHVFPYGGPEIYFPAKIETDSG